MYAIMCMLNRRRLIYMYICTPYLKKRANLFFTTAHLMNSMIQTLHSFLMHYLSSSTYKILVHVGDGHFEHVI